jgi:hypothetical protein
MQIQTLDEVWGASTHILADRPLVQDWPHDLPWQDVVPLELANERHLLPALLPLDLLDEEDGHVVRSLLAMPEPRTTPPATMLHTNLSTHGLAAQLAEHVKLALADESIVLLRFADPRVFAQLLWILPLPYLSSLCQGTTRWSIPFQGAWHELQFGDRPTPAWDMLPIGPSIALTQVGHMNQVLNRLPPPEDIKALWRTSEQIAALVGQAQNKFGLTHAADCTTFARHGVLLGEKFATHPRLLAPLRAARDVPGQYARLTDEFASSDWNKILFEVEQMQTNRTAS